MNKNDNLPWIKKYAPKNISEIIGQEKAVNKILNLIKLKPKNKALLIHGPIGSGKSSSIYAIANDKNLELLEVNASDSRNKNSIESTLGTAINQKSLFGKEKIILIDEVEGISGTKDRGAITALKSVIKKSCFPVVLTTNDAYTDKLKDIRKVSMIIEFEHIHDDLIFEHLKDICKKEKITYDESVLKTLAMSCNSDLRAGINDLQTFSSDGKFDPETSEFLLQRNQTETIQQALFKIYKTFKPEISLSSLENININIDEIINWIEYNTPKEYTKIKDLAKAFDNISLVDVYNGRIRRWQYWRFLVYMYQLLSIGISLSKEKKYSGNIEYTQSKKGLNIWQYNMKTAKKKSIALKLANVSYLSKKQAFEYVDSLKFMFKDKQLKSALIKELDLDDSEIDWLMI
jgi:replication factor C large subunit